MPAAYPSLLLFFHIAKLGFVFFDRMFTFCNL
jgi:hypothetical protein